MLGNLTRENTTIHCKKEIRSIGRNYTTHEEKNNGYTSHMFSLFYMMSESKSKSLDCYTDAVEKAEMSISSAKTCFKSQ